MAEDALAKVGLNGKSNRLPGQISGGEQERVAIARAIVNEPPILLADEPSGNLDSKTSREVMDLFRSLNEDGTTIVMVTHSPECACYARRILRISDGLLIDDVLQDGAGLSTQEPVASGQQAVGSSMLKRYPASRTFSEV